GRPSALRTGMDQGVLTAQVASATGSPWKDGACWFLRFGAGRSRARRRVEQEALVAAIEDRKRLAYVRFRGGVDTMLNALDADRELLQAQLDLRQIRLNELLSVVQLYKSLGGGWQ